MEKGENAARLLSHHILKASLTGLSKARICVGNAFLKAWEI